jgi:hypothetical protein
MLYYKTMDSKTIVMCVVALILGMLMANMLKDVCGCNVVEGQTAADCNMCFQYHVKDVMQEPDPAHAAESTFSEADHYVNLLLNACPERCGPPVTSHELRGLVGY